jgi:aminopeptidase N
VRKFAVENAGKVITCKRLQQALEAGYGYSLEQFFRQWLYGTGIPWVKGEIVSVGGGQATVTLTQAVIRNAGQGEKAWELVPSNFSLLVDLLLKYEGGEQREAVWLTQPRQEYRFALPGRPTGLVIDPDEWLLDHSKGLAGELEAEMEDLEEELGKGLGKRVIHLP